jgi:hypothetical protein
MKCSYKEKVCLGCNATYIPTGPSQSFCVPCGVINKRDRKLREKEKSKLPAGREKSRAAALKYSRSHKQEVDAKRDALANKNREMIRNIKNRPCTDCGQNFHFAVMTFDHLPQYEKKFNISEDMCRATQTLLNEIAKCEVVCANCHGIRTWRRRHD